MPEELLASHVHSSNEGRVEVLDGWRTLCVTLVIVSHLLEYSNLRLSIGPVAMTYVDQLGRYGVGVFFLISGFVICRGLLSEERKRVGVSLSGFYVRRSFRILPPLLLYVATISFFSWQGILPREGAASIWRTMTFTCNIEGANCAGFYGGHTWSLSIEEQFYVVFPLLFIFAGRARKVGVFALIALLMMSGKLMSPILEEEHNILWKFVPISMGVAAALHEKTLRRWAPKLPGVFVYLAPLAAYSMAFAVPDHNRSLIFVISLLLGVAVVLTMVKPSRLSRLLLKPPMLALGRASYGIYLWQQLVVAPHPGWNGLVYVCAIAACIGWALLSFRFIEQPLIRIGAGLSQRLARPARIAPATPHPAPQPVVGVAGAG
jgi:peptidoglycan/LPS O-acetylase OafA/YrhL